MRWKQLFQDLKILLGAIIVGALILFVMAWTEAKRAWRHWRYSQ